ncbi:MAG: hypothetical protein IJX49_06760 [Clostridia bacterium]|nr:hypothetical protein [Clostridia bacterium]
MNGKRKFSLLLMGIITAASFSGCASAVTESSSSSPELEEKDGYWYEMLYEDGEEKSLASGATMEIPLDRDVGDKSYFWMELETDVNLVGYIHYENSADSTVTNKEKFFIEKGTKDFTSFLDSFRVGAFGAFEKKMTKITLQNVDSKEGKVALESVGVTDRTYDTEAEMYISDGHLKMGTSFAVGGSVQHVEKLNAGVVEYVDENGYVRIDHGVDAAQVDVVSEEVNLVNIHDLGREIQQSYYSLVKEENGYAPKEEILYDAGLSYNPVQAGSAGVKQAQIIDYTVSESEIWIKVKPLEWFFDNTLTDSYMENTYRLDGDGALLVTNRFVNFSQFKDMDKTSACPQELPATYIVHPFNYFYCETTEGTIFDSNLSPLPTSTRKEGLNDEVSGAYFYALSREKVKGEWYAFVNDQKFGVGIYMSGADSYNASRGVKTTYYETQDNYYYNTGLYNLHGRKYIPSEYVSNYNYLSSSSILRMEDFVPLVYHYAVYVGTVEEMGTKFTALRKDGKMENEGLDMWRTWHSA